MRVRRCSCGRIIPANASICEYCGKSVGYNRTSRKVEHDKEYDKQRPERHKLYHTKAWQVVASATRARDFNICQLCRAEGRLHTNAELVHHIIPTEDDITKAFDVDNCISLCSMHHSLVHRQYDINISSKEAEQNKLNNILFEKKL